MSPLDLTNAEDVVAYLKETPYAARDVEVMEGGTANFVYRISLLTPLPDGTTSVVLKHAEGCAAKARQWTLDAVRADYEIKALMTLLDTPLFGPSSIVHIPRVYYHDSTTHTSIIEDLGTLPTVKAYISAIPSASEPTTIGAEIGYALGEWLAAFHTYSQSNPALVALFDGNTDARKLSADVYYGRLHSYAQKVYGLGGPNLQRIAAIHANEVLFSREVLTHGDFWTGNILVREPNANGDPLRLYVLDWEPCKPGSAAFDVGQFAAEAYTLGLFRNPQASEALTQTFLTAYRASRAVDAGQVAVRLGAHLVVITRGARWTEDEEKLKQVAKTGMELVEKGHDEDLDYLRHSVVGELLKSP